jgi:hypothetical protein
LRKNQEAMEWIIVKAIFSKKDVRSLVYFYYFCQSLWESPTDFLGLHRLL